MPDRLRIYCRLLITTAFLINRPSKLRSNAPPVLNCPAMLPAFRGLRSGQ